MYDYWLWDSVIPKWFCEEQLKHIDWDQSTEGEIRDEKVDVVDKKRRITDVVWVDNSKPIGCIAQTYIKMANEQAGWNCDLTSCSSIQIGKYDGNENGFYTWHTDAGYKPKEDGLIRKLSVSILLNDKNDFEGGSFEFKDFKDQPLLKQGSVLVFRSFLEHRVVPVTAGTRYSAVTWFNGPPYK